MSFIPSNELLMPPFSHIIDITNDETVNKLENRYLFLVSKSTPKHIMRFDSGYLYMKEKLHVRKYIVASFETSTQ